MTSVISSLPAPRLRPGQSLQLALDAGTVLQVTAGTLVFHEPMRWIGDTVVRPTLRLSEGQSHRLAQGGWCVLAAEGEAVGWRCHASPVLRSSWWAALRRSAGRPAAALRSPSDLHRIS